MGMLIYKALSGNDPIPFELCMGAEMYTPGWRRDGVVRHADIVSEVQPERCLLSQSQMYEIAQGAAAPQPVPDEQTGF